MRIPQISNEEWPTGHRGPVGRRGLIGNEQSSVSDDAIASRKNSRLFFSADSTSSPTPNACRDVFVERRADRRTPLLSRASRAVLRILCSRIQRAPCYHSRRLHAASDQVESRFEKILSAELLLAGIPRSIGQFSRIEYRTFHSKIRSPARSCSSGRADNCGAAEMSTRWPNWSTPVAQASNVSNIALKRNM